MQQGPIHLVLTSLKMTEEKARDFGGRGFIDAQIAKSNSMRVTHTDSVQNAEISATSRAIFLGMARASSSSSIDVIVLSVSYRGVSPCKGQQPKVGRQEWVHVQG
jgi:hypothetical protein